MSNISQLRRTSDDLNKLLERRKELLEKKPELQEFQEYLEFELSKVGPSLHNREAVYRRVFRELTKDLNTKAREISDLCCTIKTDTI